MSLFTEVRDRLKRLGQEAEQAVGIGNQGHGTIFNSIKAAGNAPAPAWSKPFVNNAPQQFISSANNQFLGGAARTGANVLGRIAPATKPMTSALYGKNAMPDLSTPAGRAGATFGKAENLVATTVPLLAVPAVKVPGLMANVTNPFVRTGGKLLATAGVRGAENVAFGAANRFGKNESAAQIAKGAPADFGLGAGIGVGGEVLSSLGRKFAPKAALTATKIHPEDRTFLAGMSDKLAQGHIPTPLEHDQLNAIFQGYGVKPSELNAGLHDTINNVLDATAQTKTIPVRNDKGNRYNGSITFKDYVPGESKNLAQGKNENGSTKYPKNGMMGFADNNQPPKQSIISQFKDTKPPVTPKNPLQAITRVKQVPQTLPLSQTSTELAGQNLQRPNINPLESLNKSSTSVLPQDVANVNGRPRGLTTSVQESPNISADVKAGVNSIYTPKPNTQLMGEAKALLNEGAKIDFKHTENLDQKVAATIQEAINLDNSGNHEAAAALYNNLSQHGTELGRGVQAFSMLDKMSPEAISLSAAGNIKRYNATAKVKIPELTGDQQSMISDAVNAIRNMAEGRDKNIAINELNNKLSNMIPSSFADKAITVWKAGLLTSLRTHERNLLGNAGMLASEVAKDPIASAADALMSLTTGKRTMSSTLSGLREFGSATTRQQIKDLVMKGYDPSSAVSKFDVQKVTWADTPVQQALKKITDAVFRPLGAEDKAFYNAAYSHSLYDQAGAEAINAGRRGDKAFIDSLVKAPTEQMLTTATADANYATFHDKTALSGVANAIKQNLKSQPGIIGDLGGAAAEVVAPFTGVPSSIVGKTVAYSPVGLVTGAVKVGRVMAGQVPELQRQAAQEVARGVIGTGLFGVGAYLMSKGLMTGQPKDATEANLWAAEGKQANSVMVGGKWRSINSVGPQFLVTLAGAKYNEEMSKPGGGSLGTFAGALGKDQLSQTFLAGVQGPLNAVTDPARYGPSYVGNQIASLIPNIVKDTSKAFDPNKRENNNTLDYVTNSIPGLRNTNIPKRDVLGNVMKQEPSGVPAFFDLFNSKTPVNNPLINELDRLHVVGQDATPSKLQASQTVYGQKTKLKPADLNNLEAQSGGAVTQTLNNIISSPNYKSLSDEEKSKMISNAVSDVRTSVKQGNVSGINIDPNAITGKYKLQMEKDQFDSTGKNYGLSSDGTTVFRRSSSGTVTTTPKIKYDASLYEAKKTTLKNSGDVKGWLDNANQLYQNYQTQLQDPSLDDVEKIALQNKIDSLTKEAGKYTSYGAFTKPKKAKVAAKATKAKKYSIKSVKNITIKAPTKRIGSTKLPDYTRSATPKYSMAKPKKITSKKYTLAKVAKIKMKA